MKRSAQGQRTRDLILDACERLFATEGYHGTTMRQVANYAGVKVALVVYHFETKMSLYTEIFARRQYVNERRLQLLQGIEDRSSPDALPAIIDALIGPSLALHDDPQDRWFAQLVLRETADPSNVDRPVMERFFDPLAVAFIDALRSALPDRPPGFHEWAYLFSVGALTQSVAEPRAHRLGAVPHADKAEFLRSFIVAGLSGSVGVQSFPSSSGLVKAAD
ncbi:TetR/AcrR family transcriptional regulator [Gordonia terrae]|uniref:TetR/AcrR family transcriptional regulator n=1 Tax=Gordonia terrae TaxID=2055 RepID=UPI003F6D54A5